MTTQNLWRASFIGQATLVLALVLPLGIGLAACSKKKSGPDQKPEATPASAGMNRKRAMDAMDGMDAMNRPIDLRIMESPTLGPDAGVVVPKGNKGMMPMKRLADPTE